VPFLGAIPLIGELFKVRNTQKRKTNFMVFIRPKILRDGIQTAIETNTKYNMLREMQLKLHNGKAPLLPFEKGPALPPADATPPTAGTPTPQTAPEGAAEPSPPDVIDTRPATRPPPAESNPVPDSQPPE
jgi:general secretion pathway protein D